MRRTIGLFAALLAVQLLAAAALYWHQQQSDRPAPDRPLLAAAPAAIDRLLVSDGQREIVLQRADEGWLMPDRDRLPANARMIDEALDAIGKVTTRWPVATSEAGHRRFEVADDAFQRRVRLYTGDQLAGDFLLGSSPAFRQVHLRRPGEQEVYVVDLNVTALPADAANWLDSALLAIANPERIEGPDFVLQATAEGEWELAGAPEDAAAEPDPDLADQLGNALANLRVQSLAADPPAVESAYTLQVTSGGEVLNYRFFTADDAYYVQRDDREAVFVISRHDYNRITGMEAQKLLRTQ